MSDLVVGIGLVFVFEGLLWALAPQIGIKFLQTAAQTPISSLRFAGFVSVVIGFVLVWLIRG